MVLRPTRHKTGNFVYVSPSQSLGLVWKKTKPNTTKGLIRQSKEIYYKTKYTQKTKARFSRLLRHPAWKRSGSILTGKDKGGDKRFTRKTITNKTRITVTVSCNCQRVWSIYQMDQRGSLYPEGRSTNHKPGRRELPTQSYVRPLSWLDTNLSSQEPEEEDLVPASSDEGLW